MKEAEVEIWASVLSQRQKHPIFSSQRSWDKKLYYGKVSDESSLTLEERLLMKLTILR